MYQRKITEDLDCGLILALKVLGGKWKPCILDAIHRGISRPSDLHRYLSMATPRVLDMQLRELEQFGAVVKKAQTGFPLRTDYELTTLGKSILPIIAQLDAWGLTHMPSIKDSLQRMEEQAKTKAVLKKAS